MPAASLLFQHRLGQQIAEVLGGDWKHYKTRNELRAPAEEGDRIIILSGANKYSPHVEVAFYFGCKYTVASNIEKLVGGQKFYYHIHQYSYNRHKLTALPFAGPCTWSVNIETPPPDLALEIANAIHGIAFPFFERFASMLAARDALASNDPWCLGGGGFWRQLLLLDVALDELSHFETWARDFDAENLGQARERIEKYCLALKRAV